MARHGSAVRSASASSAPPASRRWRWCDRRATCPRREVVAVAARDRAARARFARTHGIPRVHASYDALLADPEIDAVYNPLPNGLHCEWTMRALARRQARAVREADRVERRRGAAAWPRRREQSGRVLVEAFHWRYHPLAARMREILRAGEIGEIRHVEASTCIPMLLPGDIRCRYDLAGGALMDIGCYAVNMVRCLAGAEPEVVSAEAKLSSPKVDRCAARASCASPTAAAGASPARWRRCALLELAIRVEGSRGTLCASSIRWRPTSTTGSR